MNGHVTTRPLTWVLANYRDGDEHGWDTEFDFLWNHPAHEARLDKLTDQILADGILEPIHLGPDGRVWDGHHRLYVARLLGIEDVPVLIWAPVQVRKTGNSLFPWEAHCRLCDRPSMHLVAGWGAVAANTRGVGNRAHDRALAAAHLHLSDRHPKASA